MKLLKMAFGLIRHLKLHIRVTKIKNNFQFIFEIPAKNLLARSKMPRKWGVTINFVVGFLVYFVGF
jgi:hypothetical protein